MLESFFISNTSLSQTLLISNTSLSQTLLISNISLSQPSRTSLYTKHLSISNISLSRTYISRTSFISKILIPNIFHLTHLFFFLHLKHPFYLKSFSETNAFTRIYDILITLVRLSVVLSPFQYHKLETQIRYRLLLVNDVSKMICPYYTSRLSLPNLT